MYDEIPFIMFLLHFGHVRSCPVWPIYIYITLKFNRQMDGCWQQLHGNLTPAHACGCAAQCFEGVQRGSIIIKPKVVAHAVPHAFPGSSLAPLPCSEESWLRTVRQLALTFRIHLSYEVFKVPNGLYISQKRLVQQASLFSQICRNAAQGHDKDFNRHFTCFLSYTASHVSACFLT